MHIKYTVRPYYFFVKIVNLECTDLIAIVNKLDLKVDVDAVFKVHMPCSLYLLNFMCTLLYN